MGRQVDNKFCTLPVRALRGDSPGMPFNNLTTDRQANTTALILAHAMQTLEGLKNPFQVLLIKSDTIIFYIDYNALVIINTISVQLN